MQIIQEDWNTVSVAGRVNNKWKTILKGDDIREKRECHCDAIKCSIEIWTTGPFPSDMLLKYLYLLDDVHVQLCMLVYENICTYI